MWPFLLLMAGNVSVQPSVCANVVLCVTVNQAACFIFSPSISFSGWRTKRKKKNIIGQMMDGSKETLG